MGYHRQNLKKEGATILLTTQYLEEADQLADEIAVIDGGKVIAKGTSSELKSKVGNDRLMLSFTNASQYKKALGALAKNAIEPNEQTLTVTVLAKDTSKDVRRTLDTLEKANIAVGSIDIHKPTLDDVFLSLTGKQKQSESEES